MELFLILTCKLENYYNLENIFDHQKAIASEKLQGGKGYFLSGLCTRYYTLTRKNATFKQETTRQSLLNHFTGFWVAKLLWKARNSDIVQVSLF